MDVEGCGRGLFKVLSLNLHIGNEENHETLNQDNRTTSQDTKQTAITYCRYIQVEKLIRLTKLNITDEEKMIILTLESYTNTLQSVA
jgi:hypothetical protein